MARRDLDSQLEQGERRFNFLFRLALAFIGIVAIGVLFCFVLVGYATLTHGPEFFDTITDYIRRH